MAQAVTSSHQLIVLNHLLTKYSLFYSSFKLLLALSSILVLLTACGGGGGGTTTTSTGNSSTPATDTRPSAFNFTDQNNVSQSVSITSATITVAGINATTNISITAGTYSIAGGAYTSSAGTIINGQSVAVRHTSSGNCNTAVNTVLTIGGVSDTFTSTTAACVGTTPVQNSPPEITNTSINYSVIENQLSAFTVTTSDPNGDVISFALSGVDSSKLNIDSSGVITFKSVPDYEAPTDSGSNNIYDLIASISDGIETTSKNFTITVTDQAVEVNYYATPQSDPEHIPGTFNPKNCWYDSGGQKWLWTAPGLTDAQKAATYTQGQSVQIGGQNHNITCWGDWQLNFGIYVSGWAGQDRKDVGLYGISFYTRIYRELDLIPVGQAGIWGQWIQPNGVHPHSAFNSIEGGVFLDDKMGRSLYPKYMASGQSHLYNSNSSQFGWGFHEKRVSCDYQNGIHLANKLIYPPNLISFDENQDSYSTSGGIFFGHGWIALPIIGGKARSDWATAGGGESDKSVDSGKLTWTFFADAKNFSGPVHAYVPEMWYRRYQNFNALEILDDSSNWNSGTTFSSKLKDLYAGRITISDFMPHLAAQSWYADGTGAYSNNGNSGPYWVRKKDTLAFSPGGSISIGAERDQTWAFTETDSQGNLFMKTFLPRIPDTFNLEPFTLSSRSYSVEYYNNFVSFFNTSADISTVNLNLNNLTYPLAISARAGSEITSADEIKPDTDLDEFPWADVSGATDKYKFKLGVNVQVQEVNRGQDIYFDWKNNTNRMFNQYYKVIPAGELVNYQFIRVTENDVPAKLKTYTRENRANTYSLMPHVKTTQDIAKENEAITNTKNLFNVDTQPLDFSCWICDISNGCDPTVRETTLDDGSKISYRWYKFKDQPTFHKLKVDFPAIYTESYLDFLQAKVEQMHENWYDSKDFLSRPSSANGIAVKLAEIDNNLIITPPTGKEKGWVPIALSVEMPYGKWITDVVNSRGGPNDENIKDY